MTERYHQPPRDIQLEELRTNARLLTLIYERTADPVYLVRVEPGGCYRFVSVNDSFLRVSGYRLLQVIDAPMERVVPIANIELVRTQYERAIAARVPIAYDEKAELPAGTRYAEISLIPIFDGEGPVTHILAYIRDVTARKLVELEREHLLTNAVFLSDATRLLASLDVEHALGDMARLAVAYIGDGCAIDLFGDGSPRRVVAISADPRHPMAIGVHPAVLGGSSLNYRLGATSYLGVPLLIKGQLAGAITLRGVIGEWDRFRLDQVVTNLLTNAIKFGSGKPIEIAVTSSDGRARLRVADQGIGIDPEARERIFKPFERNVSIRHYGGLGIGLHIVKTIIVAMGGTVSVESAPGIGSEFTVELPLHRTPE